jgi:hypothetical protein
MPPTFGLAHNRKRHAADTQGFSLRQYAYGDRGISLLLAEDDPILSRESNPGPIDVDDKKGLREI